MHIQKESKRSSAALKKKYMSRNSQTVQIKAFNEGFFVNMNIVFMCVHSLVSSFPRPDERARALAAVSVLWDRTSLYHDDARGPNAWEFCFPPAVILAKRRRRVERRGGDGRAH